MPDQEPVPAVTDEIPWSDRMTEYNNRNCEAYIRLLDADNKRLSNDDIARRILGIDPTAEPERARKAVKSHMSRARWMGEVGYRYLVSGDYPGRERRMAEDVKFLRSLGIPIVPRGGRTPR